MWGLDGADGRRPATLGEAAAAGSMRPDTLRRYLHRPDMRALIAAERQALLACSQQGRHKMTRAANRIG